MFFGAVCKDRDAGKAAMALPSIACETLALEDAIPSARLGVSLSRRLFPSRSHQVSTNEGAKHEGTGLGAVSAHRLPNRGRFFGLDMMQRLAQRSAPRAL